MVRLTGKKKPEKVVTEQDAQAEVQGIAEIDKKRTKKAWQNWTVADVLKQVKNIPADTDKDALKFYVEESLDALKEGAPKAIGIAPADYIVQSIENYVNDGGLDASEDSDVLEGDDDQDQPIIEVSQDEVKKALKSLLSTSNEKIALYYEKFDVYNKEFFGGKLSTPVITIDKLNNRTLGNYTIGQDRMALTHHIRFNANFVALNTEERVLETLRHEMIHQWQDEILYIEKGSDRGKQIELPSMDEAGEVVFSPSMQKKRPKEWHNADFKIMAKWVGIPAKGAKCYGNDAKMPEPKSYNRKFVCGCVASNGYPVTVYSTRQIFATCNICEQEYMEVEKQMFKNAKTIEVSVSHVEKTGEDAVEMAMKEHYTEFKRFAKKGEKDDFIERLQAGEIEEKPATDIKDGVYQKNHNAYGLGFRYWVAYGLELTEDKMSPDELRKAVDDVTKQKGKGKGDKFKAPTSEGGEKKPKGKIVKFPGGEEAPAAPADEPKQERVYSVDNPEDLIDLYNELGTVRKVAERLGVGQSTISGRAKKFGIDWNSGSFNADWDKK